MWISYFFYVFCKKNIVHKKNNKFVGYVPRSPLECRCLVWNEFAFLWASNHSILNSRNSQMKNHESEGTCCMIHYVAQPPLSFNQTKSSSWAAQHGTWLKIDLSSYPFICIALNCVHDRSIKPHLFWQIFLKKKINIKLLLN